MKDTTVKLSGHSKDRFLERFFAAEEGIEPNALKRLTERSKEAFSSLRVRKALLAPQRIIRTPVQRRTPSVPVSPPVSPPVAGPKAEPAVSASPTATPPVDPTPAAAAVAPAPAPIPAVEAAAFDPYVFGLVPVFQREGRDGLLAKLAGIAELDQLRQMAKAQQVVLPQQLRSGEATLEDVRTGIADAVAKRIADRRAAAG